MEKQIIAGKFILIKTKGSNGSLTTYLAEDPMTGDRVIVKDFSDDNPMALELIKAMNLLNDKGCRGILTAIEGGMLEDEPGYYLVFPEIPGPALEEFLVLNPTMQEEELTRLAQEMEEALHDLHGAGLFHLFLSPRNIFYSPGRPIYIKDPALNYQLYSFLLQELQGFDYSYFSPRLMDGGEGCPEEDLFSMGRVLKEVVEKVEWVGREEARQSWVDRANAMMACADPTLPPGGEHELDAMHGCAVVATKSDSSPDAAESDIPISWQEECSSAADPDNGDAADTGPVVEEEAAQQPDSIKALRLQLENLSGEGGAGRCRVETAGGKRPAGKRLLALSLVVILLSIVLLAAYGMPDEHESEADLSESAGQITMSGDAPEIGQEPAGNNPEELPETPADMAILPETSEAVQAQDVTSFTGDNDSVNGNAAADAKITETDGGLSPTNRPPVASFSVSPSEGSSPLQVYLDAGASYDPDGSIVSYSWSCGGSGVSIYRVFESSVIPSRISITLTVTDNGGASSSTTRSVTLY